ncbi:putative het domain-containing protein [Diaporthe ampelina]|uniref:Putative het domain-containing protein n=1 Tax=Diaporthe ampelina TaxID=1214573 RepID=A0A0G2HVF9_9PEZI|nr:putative het domain-containing protein [Diaporthe ampelina]
MRLLDTTTFELRLDGQEFFQDEGYAILSHRWVGPEVTFDEIAQYAPDLRDAGKQRMKSPQLDKIRGACEIARKQGFRWMWIDNCCVNKSSAIEEAESINSMFKWYRDARVCITYLSDVRSGGSPNPPEYEAVLDPGANEKRHRLAEQASDRVFQRFDRDEPSEWFSRGWTLPELLAPRDMDFYDADWRYIGSKASLAAQIQRITGIDADYLVGARHFRRACIATKMSWAAGRATTRVEDIAYSLFGLFGITMTPRYGEGPRAFMRLQQELLATTEDESLFAWRMPGPAAADRYDIEQSPKTTWTSGEWGLLAPSPDWFNGCGNVTIERGPTIQRPARAFHMGRQGIVIPTMPSEQFTKYKLMLLFSPLLTIGAIPVWIYVMRKLKKKAQAGVPFTLNCWPTEGDDTTAAISVYLTMLPNPTSSYAGDYEYKFKRTRCSELLLVRKYALRGATGEAVALQPEVRFGS